MKRIILAGVSLLFLSASQMFAAVESELFLSGGGSTCIIDVSTGNVVTTTGDCGGLAIASTGDHGKLTASGTLDGFTISDTANGSAATIRPDLEDLNQLDVSGPGSSTLTASYTDTGYTDVASHFLIATSVVALTKAGTVDFTGLVDATNTIPATTVIGSFTNQAGPSTNANGVFVNPIFPTTPYSLTAQTVINFTKAGTVQANYSIAAIPEGAAVPLFGGVALLFGSLVLRRKRVSEQ